MVALGFFLFSSVQKITIFNHHRTFSEGDPMGDYSHDFAVRDAINRSVYIIWENGLYSLELGASKITYFDSIFNDIDSIFNY